MGRGCAVRARAGATAVFIVITHPAWRMERAPARRIVAEQLMLGRKARRIAPPPSPPHVPRDWDSDGVSSGVHTTQPCVTDTKSCFTM